MITQEGCSSSADTLPRRSSSPSASRRSSWASTAAARSARTSSASTSSARSDMTPAGDPRGGQEGEPVRRRSSARCRRATSPASRSTPATARSASPSYMRIHTLESTGGKTYSQMGRFLTPRTARTTNDATLEAREVTRRRASRSRTAPRNLWVTETALTTALNISFFAEQVSHVQHRRRDRPAPRPASASASSPSPPSAGSRLRGAAAGGREGRAGHGDAAGDVDPKPTRSDRLEAGRREPARLVIRARCFPAPRVRRCPDVARNADLQTESGDRDHRRRHPPSRLPRQSRSRVPEDSLQLLLSEISSHRLLTAAEEVFLAKRIERGDLEAKHRMVEAQPPPRRLDRQALPRASGFRCST